VTNGRGEPRAWSQSRGPTGAFASVQRASLPCPAVEHSPAGARRLGNLYWHELVRSTCGLVRARVSPDAVVLRLQGIGPALLRFGRGEPTVTSDSVTCRFAVAHDQRLRDLVPLELTPFDEAARSALARREGRARQA